MWDNKRREGTRILARLDRIYTPRSLEALRTGEDYKILGDSNFSDHLPVRRRIWLELETRRSSIYVMNVSYLKDETVQRKIKHIWASNTQLPFYGKIKKCVRFYKEFCVQKAKENRAEEDMWRKRLERAVITLQATPEDAAAQASLLEASSFLRQVEERKLEGQRLRSRIKWKQKGDQGLREFFQAHTARSTASHITALEVQSGQV